MNCCITELGEKEIINLKDGCRIGCVSDVEIDTCSGKLCSLIVYGKSKIFGLGGRESDIKICWEQIEVIGDDTILVNIDCPAQCKKAEKTNIIGSLFREA